MALIFENPRSRGVENSLFNFRVKNRLTLPIYSSGRQVQLPGSIIYDDFETSDPKLYYSNGDEWKQLGGGVIVVPTLPGTVDIEGQIVYDQSTQTLYYSDGVSWIEIDTAAGEDWAGSLLAGNTSVGGGTNNPTISAGDSIVYPGLGSLTVSGGKLALKSDAAGADVALENDTGTSTVSIALGSGDVNVESGSLVRLKSNAAAATTGILIDSSDSNINVLSSGDVLNSVGGDVQTFSQTFDVTASAGAGDAIALTANNATIANRSLRFLARATEATSDALFLESTTGGIRMDSVGVDINSTDAVLITATDSRLVADGSQIDIRSIGAGGTPGITLDLTSNGTNVTLLGDFESSDFVIEDIRGIITRGPAPTFAPVDPIGLAPDAKSTIHCGRVQITSAGGAGLEFSVTFPQALPASVLPVPSVWTDTIVRVSPTSVSNTGFHVTFDDAFGGSPFYVYYSVIFAE